MLSDKVCIVAGGGHGIGEATAVALGDLGASVVVNDLGTSLEGEGESEEPAQETVDRIEEAGGTAMAHYGDISSFEYTEDLVADTLDEYGRIDGAVNFAGILRDAISYKMTEDEWDPVIDVHLKGHFTLLRNLAAHWRSVAGETEADELDSQRSFVSITSPAALGNVGQLNYGSAKAGILGMTRTAAIELARLNIRVNALMPLADTRMTDTVPGSEDRPPRPPERVAEAVGFLMSDAADDVSGCTIRAVGDEIALYSDPEIQRTMVKDGGWTAADLADDFRDTMGENQNLDRTDLRF
jgi:NAD(P)-dependent dehydrogenase (short-subunit alcohol dehydrogenase family)